MEKLKSVKLWFCIGLTIMFHIQLSSGLINGDQYAQLMMWIITGYMVGNVGTKIANKGK